MNSESRRAMTAARLSSSIGRAAFLLASGLCATAIHAQSAPPSIAPPTATSPGTTPPITAGSGNGFAKMDAAEAAEEANDAILVTAHLQHGAVATDLPPEVTLNSAAIGALGAADLNEVFEDLAPEFRNSASGPGKTAATPIVLVNGQRIAGFSSVRDLPPEAVRRIEVFPEKVALQYGYGPDEKVVNIVLRSNYHALTLLGRYTAAPENWRGVYRAKADLLRIGEHSHWNLDLDYSHLDPIYSATTLPDPGAVPSDGSVPAHTLAAQSDDLTLSGDYTRDFGAVTADLTGRLDLSALQSRLGLADGDGDLLVAQGSPDLISGPRYRSDRSVDAQTSLTFNGHFDGGWHWSFIGKLDDTMREINTADTPTEGGFDAIMLPSPGLIGNRCNGPLDTGCVVTETRTASGDYYLNGKVLPLPAGSINVSLRAGFAFSGIRSQSPLASTEFDRNRDEGNVQANIDIPITTSRSPIGKLSVGLNGEARRLSDFGTLTTIGSSLEWTPIKPVQIVASVRREEQAPTLQQLANGTLVTPDLREFDFVTDATSIVQRIDGGNNALQQERNRVANLRVQVNPLRSTDLQLSADYTIEHMRDPIAIVTASTAETMAAFPGMFARNDQGFLTGMDASPVNLYRRDQQQLRWGINYSTAFGPRDPRPDANGKPVARDQFQIALYDTWRLQDDVVLREGLPTVNLLNGGLISDQGGTPKHELELQTTVSTRTWSADINAHWQLPTTVTAGEMGTDRLTFTQGVNVDLRLQINLSSQQWLTRLLPFLRGKLNISADNILGAHTSVHEANGVVPPAYSESYLNPTGRTFRITLRKRFH